jgi:activator of HSP90 ATPase
LLETKIPSTVGELKVTKVASLEGDAFVNIRKGKRRVGYELKATIEWQGNTGLTAQRMHMQEFDVTNMHIEIGEIKDTATTTTVKGIAKIPDIAEDVDDQKCK